MMVMEMAVMAVYMVMFMGMNPALMPMSMVHDKRRRWPPPSRSFVAAGRRRPARAVAGPPGCPAGGPHRGARARR